MFISNVYFKFYYKCQVRSHKIKIFYLFTILTYRSEAACNEYEMNFDDSLESEGKSLKLIVRHEI